MEKLKKIIEQYGRWQHLEDYVGRIETFAVSDFPFVIENSKSLLEVIAKDICSLRSQEFDKDDGPSKLLRLAFGSIGIQSTNISPQIAGALVTIGQFMGELRNEIGPVSHGRTREELQANKEKIDEFTREFLISSTEIIACFLIQIFEFKLPLIDSSKPEEKLDYDDCQEFNEFLDESYGEFPIGILSYTASEILYNVDNQAYFTEYKEFNKDQE